MKVQNIVSGVRSRVEAAGKPYQDAFKACVFAQRKAFGVVTRNGQTLANTEIGAAKNIFAAARASFDKARRDGVRKVVNNPQAYVPNGRNQIVSAYKDTIGLLRRTGNELTGVASTGYKSVRRTLSPRASDNKTAASKPTGATSSGTRGRKAASTASGGAKKTAARTTTAKKRKTAATRKTTSKAGGTASTRAQSTTKPASPASTSAPSTSGTAKTDDSAS